MDGYLCIQNISQNRTSVLAHTGGQIFCKRRSSTDQNIGLSHFEAFQRGVELLNKIYLGSWYQKISQTNMGCMLVCKGQGTLKNESRVFFDQIYNMIL